MKRYRSAPFHPENFYGRPGTVLVDNSPEFLSATFIEAMTSLGIDVLFQPTLPHKRNCEPTVFVDSGFFEPGLDKAVRDYRLTVVRVPATRLRTTVPKRKTRSRSGVAGPASGKRVR